MYNTVCLETIKHSHSHWMLIATAQNRDVERILLDKGWEQGLHFSINWLMMQEWNMNTSMMTLYHKIHSNVAYIIKDVGVMPRTQDTSLLLICMCLRDHRNSHYVAKWNLFNLRVLVEQQKDSLVHTYKLWKLGDLNPYQWASSWAVRDMNHACLKILFWQTFLFYDINSLRLYDYFLNAI